MSATRNVFRALAGAGGVLLIAASAAPGAAVTRGEDSGDVQATVRKTVLQTATATGEIQTSRMYTQVSAAGNGTKTVTVPVGVDSNRNLNQFGPFPMEGQSIVFNLTVDGGVEERTLTDAEISPMKVSVKVMLDGVEVEPADLVGQDGVVDVQYTVRNSTARTEDITYSDVEGNEITEPMEVADPYAGSLDITLPMGFNEITAPGATIAGDGTNQTSLGYTMVLFPPLGSPEVTVGYQARVTNASMPAAVFSFLPIIPYDNSTIAGTADAYKGGAAVGAQIWDAGVQIGDNLLKLQEGAGQLVAGLGQLAAGASQLSDGLVNTAAPGSAALADGATQVSDGLGELNSNVPALEDGVNQLDDGANQISDGLNELDSKVPALESGVGQLNTGAQQLSGGLDQLNSQMPALVDGVKLLDEGGQLVAGGLLQLQATLEGLPAAVKATPEYQQLVGGVDLVIAGLRYPGTTDCDVALAGGTPSACGAMDAVELISGLLATGADDLTTKLQPLVQALYFGGAGQITGVPAPCNAPPTVLPPATNPPDNYCDAVSSVYYALFAPAGAPGFPLGGLQNQADTAATSLEDVYTGVDAQLIPGLDAIKLGIGQLVDAIAAKITEDPKFLALVAGGQDLSAGLSDLNSKIGPLAAGVGQLTTGASQLAAGTKELNSQVPTLASGVAQLAAGGEQLADGTGELADSVPTLASGVQQLDDGAAQVADGADQLATGLGDAADGSQQLADGLGQAEPGGAQIEDGAGQLKEQGADALATTGKEAQLGYAKDVAMLEASQQLGLEGAGVPFGFAEGTDVTTTAAIQVQLAGISADSENNLMKYGLGIALIAGAAGAAFAAARKLSA
jgi:putative membrane protein